MKDRDANCGSWLSKTFIGVWLRSIRDRFRLYQTPGHIPPESLLAKRLIRILIPIWFFIQVGPLKIIGEENLKVNGRVIYCPNHSSMFDGVVYAHLPIETRSMGAVHLFKMGWGMLGFILGKLGAFPVDRAHGKAVVDPAISLVASGTPLLLFPEGTISVTGKLLPLKSGPAYIASGAWEMLGKREPVAIVPIHLCFHRRDEKTANIGNYLAMGFKWRGGATMVVGKPIWMHELAHHEPDAIMAQVRQALLSHDCALNRKARESLVAEAGASKGEPEERS